MAVTTHAVGTVATVSNATSIAPTYPTNSVGDLMLLFWVGANASSVPTTPTGFQKVGTAVTGLAASVAVYSKVVTSVLSGTLTVTQSREASSAQFISYSGASRAAVRPSNTTTGASTATTSVNNTNVALLMGGFAIQVVGAAAAYTGSATASDSGSVWTPTNRAPGTSNPGLAVWDGPISGAPVSTALKATMGSSQTYSQMELTLLTDAEVSPNTTDEDFDAATVGTLPSPWQTPITGGTFTGGSPSPQADTLMYGAGNYLRWQPTASAAGGFARTDYGTTAYGDTDVYLTVADTAANSNDVWVYIDGSSGGTGVTPNSCYGLKLSTLSGASLWEVTASSFTQIGSTVGSVFGLAVGSAVWRVRLQSSGTTVQAKVWQNVGPEPAAWTITGTPTATGKTGVPGLSAQAQSATNNSVYVDSWSITTNPQFVSSASAAADIPTAATTGSVTVNAPASIVSGNLLVAFLGDSSGIAASEVDTAITPSGWTLRSQWDNTNDAHIYMWTKVATGSEPSTYTFGINKTVAAPYDLTCAVLQYTGVQYDQVAHNSSANVATNSPTAPTLTTTTANGSYIAAWVQRIGNGAITPPSTLISRERQSAGGLYSMDVADKPYTTAGASGTFVATSAGTSDRYQALTVSLIPGSGGSAFSASPALSGSGTLTAVQSDVDVSGVANLSGSGSLTAVVKPAFALPASIARNSETNSVWTIAGSTTLTGGQTDPLGGTRATKIDFPALQSYAAPGPEYTTADGIIAGHTYDVVVWVKSADGTTFSANASIEDFGDPAPVGNGYPVQPITLSWVRVVRTITVSSAPNFRFLWYNIGSIADNHSLVTMFEGIYDQATPGINLSGSGTLSVVVTPKPTAPQSLSGSGTLTTTVIPGPKVSVSLSGSGALTSASVPAVSVAAALTGSGALSTAATITATGTATLSGSGTLTSVNTPAYSAAASLSGSGTLTTVGVLGFNGIATLSGSGSLTSAVIPGPKATVALSGSGALTTATLITASATVALSGSGSLSSSANLTATGAGALSGSGTLTTVNTPAYPVSVSLSGSGSLSAVGVLGFASAVNLTGSGSLSTSVIPKVSVAAALSGSGTLSAVVLAGSVATATLSGTGTLSAASVAGATASVSLSGTGTLSSSSKPATAVNVALSGSGSLSTSSTLAFSAVASLSGSGTLSYSASATTAGSASPALTGSGSLSTSVTTQVSVNASLSGSGSLTSTATPKTSSTVSLSGSGSLSASAKPGPSATVNLTGSGSLSSSNKPGPSVSVALSGSGSLGAVGGSSGVATVSLSGSGTLTVGTTLTTKGTATLSGSGSLSVTRSVATSRTVALSGDGALSVAPILSIARTVALSGSGSLSVAVVPGGVRTVALSGTGALGAVGYMTQDKVILRGDIIIKAYYGTAHVTRIYYQGTHVILP